jgi:hypothetical protein
MVSRGWQPAAQHMPHGCGARVDGSATRAVIAEIQRTGKTTLAAIAQELETRGVRTPAGRDRWAPAQVSRLLAD